MYDDNSTLSSPARGASPTRAPALAADSGAAGVRAKRFISLRELDRIVFYAEALAASLDQRPLFCRRLDVYRDSKSELASVPIARGLGAYIDAVQPATVAAIAVELQSFRRAAKVKAQS